MSGISPQQAARKVAAYKIAVMDEIERRCDKYLDQLLDAAIKYRLTNEDAYDFTGNLINSICVGLWRERKLVKAVYSSNKVPKAVWSKATAMYDKDGNPVRHYLAYDYSGGVDTYLTAEVNTNRGWGKTDALMFINSYQPEGDNYFDIVVAYTTEYALFVERVRKTTGILNTYMDAEALAFRTLELGRSN